MMYYFLLIDGEEPTGERLDYLGKRVVTSTTAAVKELQDDPAWRAALQQTGQQAQWNAMLEMLEGFKAELNVD